MTSNARKRCTAFPSSIDIHGDSNPGTNSTVIPNEQPTLTEKRCTTFLSSRDLEQDCLLEGNNTPELQHKPSSSLITELPLEPKEHTSATKFQRRPGWKPPHLPISAKRTSAERIDGTKRFASHFPESGSLWAKYKQFTKARGPGKVVLAYEIKSPKVIVAIKECKAADTERAQLLFRTSHPNIVNLQDAFIDERDVYLAYERMDLPLEQLHSDIKLEERHIATICREVLLGLSYIHQQLQICHLSVKCSTIFLSTQGHIKIGGIGSAMLLQHPKQEGRDIKSVGWMMTEIMEPGTAYPNPESILLESPGKWSHDILDFQKNTEHSVSQSSSPYHVFLAIAASSNAGSLVPLVLIAMKNWEA
ncbi:uncharacterized protein GIQ15_04326 [Arthroderma uncinatum]|uniref:uncharacterized protein n=1 Tax=Arthroderma uncinatum TaxID=74035 RepID=UPI00144AEB79|nr:uncharacterized protein GIQ15_04326 [Arthroderma uncinatum]KAF3481567.1 hypothetical protein GIQ15_04326 [Arthroderma uncinatum]